MRIRRIVNRKSPIKYILENPPPEKRCRAHTILSRPYRFSFSNSNPFSVRLYECCKILSIKEDVSDSVSLLEKKIHTHARAAVRVPESIVFFYAKKFSRRFTRFFTRILLDANRFPPSKSRHASGLRLVYVKSAKA